MASKEKRRPEKKNRTARLEPRHCRKVSVATRRRQITTAGQGWQARAFWAGSSPRASNQKGVQGILAQSFSNPIRAKGYLACFSCSFVLAMRKSPLTDTKQPVSANQNAIRKQ
jgi:hypothetical protein